ncbi:MAG: family 1 glycosylhydrolase, partial [Burkholderiaceae bacterium]|nr:family 1 glycosylhydrolase [Burkholderiaceae bacterium]
MPFPQRADGSAPAHLANDLTAMGWVVTPAGLGNLVKRVHRDYPQIPYLVITENGSSYDDVKVNGEVVDLSHELSDGDHVEPILISEPTGLSVLRHSVAHIVAQATQAVFTDVKLGIGPPTKDGFFYDFGTARTFTPEDLLTIEKKCVEIINSGQKFARRVTNREAARVELKNEPFKIRLLGADDDATVMSEDVMEIGGGELTIYDNIDLRSDELRWCDLCRGPHVPDTRYIDARAIKLMRT